MVSTDDGRATSRSVAKIGEDVTKTLKEIPRRFKVIETVRGRFTCRDCKKIR